MHLKTSLTLSVALSLGVVSFPHDSLAQSCGYDPAYDSDDDGMMDMVPPGCNISPGFPNYPTLPVNTNGFTVCNRSSEDAFVAYSYYNGQAWVREGWRSIGIGQCSQLTSDILTRYVYIYAEGTNGGSWAGNQSICIHPTDEFTLPPISNCSAPYENRPFAAIDTGESRSFRLDLFDRRLL